MTKVIPFLIALALVLVAIHCAYSDETAPAKGSMPKHMLRSDAVDAYVHAIRADLSDGKVQLINNVMHLSSDEAAKFWPTYHDYEAELFDLGDERVELIRQFADAQRDGKLTSEEASSLADKYFDFETKRLALTKKYYGVIAKDLSPVRGAQFTQIENRVGTVVDLIVASEIPLIRTEGTARTASHTE